MAAPLDQAVKTPAGAEPATVKTLVLTDLVESTRLFETLGDRRAARLSARHERIARDLLVRCAGREIDKTDGFLLLFERTVDALRFALGYHRALDALSREEGIEIAARVGIHLGEVIQRKNAPEDVARGAKPVEIEGFAKPMAARVMALAKGRQTLLTRGAFDLARLAAARERVTDGELRWLAHGPYVLKGVSEPVEIFEVGERGFAPLLVPKSTAKARRAVHPEDELTLGWRPAPGLEVPRRARWRLVEKLGEGGFGEVWRAEHEKTGENRVFKFCYRTESLRSLQREVTLFRLLKETLGSRDDIARILDWSFDQAPYFLECEYTAGGNLLEWVRDQGGPAEVPLATKLELMAQVADALSAAHSVGVLHKDVKPSNVLVTTGSGGRPQVRLTDFGIGLVTDREALARQGITVFDLTEMVAESTGSVGGTHLYMAPELVEGRNATVQADVYALGVMLYQFVIGDFSHALAPGWRRDVADEILQEDLAAMVDGRPERRMRDAQRVAERLRSLEERREAREAAHREREEREAERVALEKAHRRRKVSAIAAAVSLLVLLVVSFLALQALDARREADRRRGQAEGLIGFMVGDLRQKLEPIGRLDVLDEVGEAALDYFESVPESDLTDEELLSRSQALYQIGDVRRASGDLPAAREAFEESRSLAASLVDRAPKSVEARRALMTADFGLGYVSVRQREMQEALTSFQAYLDRARELSAEFPDDPEWQLETSYALSNLGTIYETQSDLERASRAFTEALAIRRRLVAIDPGNTVWRRDLAVAHNKLGVVLDGLGRPREALEHFRADVETTRELSRLAPTDAALLERLAVGHSYLGFELAAMGRPEEALAEYRTAHELFGDLTERDERNGQWRRALAVVRRHQAKLMARLGQRPAALALLAGAVEDLSGLVRDTPTDAGWRQDLAFLHVTFAQLLVDDGRLGEAREQVARGIHLLDRVLETSTDSSDAAARVRLSEAHDTDGRIHAVAGDRAAARAAWSRAAEVLAPIAPSESTREVLAARARAQLRLGPSEEAVEIVRQLEEMGYSDPDLSALVAEHGGGATTGTDDPLRSDSARAGPESLR